MDKENGIEKTGFYIIILLITAGAVFASWNLATVKPTEINYTINIDKDIISQTTTNTAINIEQLQEEVIRAIQESGTQYMMESSNNAMNRISIIIAVTAIFFTVLVVIVALFQYMKNREYEKEFIEYKNKVDELKESETDLKRISTILSSAKKRTRRVRNVELINPTINNTPK